MGIGARNLAGNALCVLVASLERMVANEDVLERSAVLAMFEVILEKGSAFDNIQARRLTCRVLSIGAIHGVQT